MSNSKKMEKIADALANSFLQASKSITGPLELSEGERFTVVHKALAKALMAHSSNSQHCAVQLASDDTNWLAMGRIRVGGDSLPATATKDVIETLTKTILKDEGCDCNHCKASSPVTKETINADLERKFGSKTHQEPNVNEQTAQEILKEIESETTH